MRRSLLVILTALLAAALGAGVAVAATGDGRAVSEGSVPVQTVAQAPEARLAVLVDGNAGLNSFGILRGKGVHSVTNPQEGVYCIRPNVANMVPSRVVPSVSVEWAFSPTNAVEAQWASNRHSCPRGTISIVTMNGEDGTWDLDNNVAFTVVVP